MNTFLKSVAAPVAALVMGLSSLAWTNSSKANEPESTVDVDQKVCVAKYKEVSKKLDACGDKLKSCGDDERALLEAVKHKCPNIDFVEQGGKYVVIDKPVTTATTKPTTTSTTKPTVTATATATTPPPVQKKYYCVDEAKWETVPSHCHCPDGQVLVTGSFAHDRVCVGKPGKDGTNGTNGKSVTVTDNKDGTATITDGDGHSFVIRNPKDAEKVEGCTLKDNGDNTATLTCPPNPPFIIRNGKDGQSSTGDLNFIPSMIDLEFSGNVWGSRSKQGPQLGEGLGMSILGRLGERTRVFGSMDVQWTSYAPRTGGMAYLWPQIGFRVYTGTHDLYYAQSWDFGLGLQQGVSRYGNRPTIDGRQYDNGQFWGATATLSVAWNVRLASWLSVGARGMAGYGWWLTTVTPCPPAPVATLPSDNGFKGYLDVHASLTF